MTSEAALAVPSSQPAAVQAHWLMAAGRSACFAPPKVTVPEGGFVAAPFCGACLLVILAFRLHGEQLWKGRCLPPDMRPSRALEILRDTPWSTMYDLTGLASGDTWWFETAT